MHKRKDLETHLIDPRREPERKARVKKKKNWLTSSLNENEAEWLERRLKVVNKLVWVVLLGMVLGVLILLLLLWVIEH